MPEITAAPELGDFIELRELASRADIRAHFPTEQSLRWYVRHHRNELVEAGALISVANRLRFHPAAFARTVVSIGARNVLQRVGAAA